MARPCAICDKPSTFCCQGCTDVPGQDEPEQNAPWYCSDECAEAHSPAHEPQCDVHEKVLRRAVQIVKKAWITFRENSFEARVEIRGRDASNIPEIYEHWRDDFFVGPIDFQTITDQKEREAILALNNCGTTVFIWGKVLYAFLEGLNEVVLSDR